MEGARGEYFFPFQARPKGSGTITMVLPCNGSVTFRVHDSLVNDQGNWTILSVQIDGKPENLLIALIYDYLQEYWRTREEIFPWLKGQADLSIKV
ncbi:MAG TPA: hypothetical protein P5274_01595 [Candidatus Paceibacterota bacterium]|nr:hypothetical protein [Candidatus Paceibacterota bacterium]